MKNINNPTRSECLGFLSSVFDNTFVKNIELIFKAKSPHDYKRKFPFAMAPREVFLDFCNKIDQVFEYKVTIVDDNFDAWQKAVEDTCLELYCKFCKSEGEVGVQKIKKQLVESFELPDFYKQLYVFENHPKKLLYATAMNALNVNEYCLLTGIPASNYRKTIELVFRFLNERYGLVPINIRNMQYRFIVKHYASIFDIVWQFQENPPKSYREFQFKKTSYVQTLNEYKALLKESYGRQLDTIKKHEQRAEILNDYMKYIDTIK